MEAIREQLRKPLGAGIIGFVIGLVIGWFVIGWGVYPVEWTNAAPGDLRPDAREDYLRMAIANYYQTQDSATAIRRFQELGGNGPATLNEIIENPGLQRQAAIEAFRDAVAGSPEPSPTASPGGSAAKSPLSWLWVLCLGAAAVAVALAAFYLFRRSGTGAPTPAMQAAEASRKTERTDFAATGDDLPLAQFVTTYLLGDDLFDDSFSIDSPSGEFLGECGVGIAETIGVGEPKRVSGYEIWLFDKNDIQTVTKVVMSGHAFKDPAIRDRLSAKGEPVLAKAGEQVVLETATLQLVGRVMDLAYGDSALPENSFFARFTLELAVWSK